MLDTGHWCATSGVFEHAGGRVAKLWHKAHVQSMLIVRPQESESLDVVKG